MARQLTYDDRELIELVNSNGEVTGSFYWNPADLDIAKRCEKVMERLNSISAKDTDRSVDEMAEEVREQFNYLLNSPGAADALFKCHPLTPREDGTTYAEYALSRIVSFIEQELDVRLKKTSSRVKKYTGKYRK